jgi:hypothetical protein
VKITAKLIVLKTMMLKGKRELFTKTIQLHPMAISVDEPLGPKPGEFFFENRFEDSSTDSFAKPT